MSSPDRRWAYEVALPAAQRWQEAFRPGCRRVEIAGSLRRHAVDVGDIEIVLQPGPNFDAVLAEIEASPMCSQHPQAKNMGMYSKKYIDAETGLQVDVFIVRPPHSWPVVLLRATGPYQFNIWLATERARGGGKPQDLRFERNGLYDLAGQKLPVETEADVFRAFGLEFIPPDERAPRWRRAR